MHFLRPDPLCQRVDPHPALTVRDYWALALLTAGALVLRLIGLNQGLWFDEIITLMYYVPLPVQDILQLHDGRNNHIFYSIMAHFSWSLLGESAWSIRLPAALLGTATIPAAYYLGLQLANRREALLAAVFLVTSYHHVWYSQSARGYSGVLFATILLSIIFVRLLHTRKPPWLDVFLYAVIAALATWIHLTAAMVVIAHAVVWFGLSIKHRRSGIRSVNARAALAILFSGLISVALNAGVIESQTIDYVAPVAKRAAAAAKATAKATALAAAAATKATDPVAEGDAAPAVPTTAIVATDSVETAYDDGVELAATETPPDEPAGAADDPATAPVIDSGVDAGTVASAVQVADSDSDPIASSGPAPAAVPAAAPDAAAAAAIAAKRIGNIIVAPSTPGKNWMAKEIALALSLAIPGGMYALPVVALLLLCFIGAGLWSYARQGWLSFGMLTMPFVVIVTIFVVLSELMFPRFLLSCAVFMLLIGVRGGFVLSHSLFPSISSKQAFAVGLAFALVSVVMVPRAWQPKQDFEDAFDYLQTHAEPGDALACSRNMKPMFRYFLGVECEMVTSSRELGLLEETHERTWYLHTLQFGSRNNRLWKRLRSNYRVEKVAASTVNRGDIFILLNDGGKPAR